MFKVCISFLSLLKQDIDKLACKKKRTQNENKEKNKQKRKNPTTKTSKQTKRKKINKKDTKIGPPPNQKNKNTDTQGKITF